MVKKPLRLIIAGMSIGIVVYLVLAVYVGLNVYHNDKRKSDAIIVLGARSYLGTRYNPCLVSRVEEGSDLIKEGFARKIIFSGGNDGEDGKNEARTMEKIALEMGIPQSDIILETNSSSTYENLLFSRAILQQHSFHSAIIVTEPFHSPRASLVADKLGINHTMSPVMTSPCWTRWTFLSRFFLREPVALLYYWAKGRL